MLIKNESNIIYKYLKIFKNNIIYNKNIIYTITYIFTNNVIYIHTKASIVSITPLVLTFNFKFSNGKDSGFYKINKNIIHILLSK